MRVASVILLSMFAGGQLELVRKSVDFELHDEPVRYLYFSEDGSKLVSSGDSQLFVSDVSTGAKEREAEIMSPIGAFGKSKLLGVAQLDGLKIVSLPSMQQQKFLRTESEFGFNANDAIYAMAGTADANTIAVSGFDDLLIIYSLQTGTRKPIRLEDGTIEAMAFTPDGKRLACANLNGSVSIWSAAGELVQKIDAFDKPAATVSFSSDGKLLLAGGEDGKLRVYSASDWKEQRAITLPGPVFAAIFQPNSKRFAAAYSVGRGKGSVDVYSAEDGSKITADAQHDWVLSLAFSPDGKRLAGGGEDGSIRLWELSPK